ncbi:MAG: MarR family winged helix-turn-helix transcriptional regulator [Ferrimicrobium sp.]
MCEGSGLPDTGRAMFHGLLTMYSKVVWRLDDSLLSSHGVTLGEFEVLLHLAGSDGGSLRLSELAERALVSRSALSRRVDSLAKSGWVERSSCPTDRRGTYAVLTDAGRETLASAMPTHDAVLREAFLDHLDLADMRSFLRIVEKVSAAPVRAVT